MEQYPISSRHWALGRNICWLNPPGWHYHRGRRSRVGARRERCCRSRSDRPADPVQHCSWSESPWANPDSGATSPSRHGPPAEVWACAAWLWQLQTVNGEVIPEHLYLLSVLQHKHLRFALRFTQNWASSGGIGWFIRSTYIIFSLSRQISECRDCNLFQILWKTQRLRLEERTRRALLENWMELEAKPLAQKENRQSLSWLSFVLFCLIFFFFLIKPKTVTPKTGVFIKLGVCAQSRHTRDARMWGCRNENKREKPTNYQNYRSHRYPWKLIGLSRFY